ncbi:Phosphoribosylformimino-5-aminoimidazole carboxamide ribotide isomerase [Lachnospiraceae bacterium TWA4]|nr:Phosphoribosylformimino-5-aminoimidazole carboxamide ribotide isomerase [Lachnospiraceae bacterium TWA4]
MRFRPCIDIHNGKIKQIVGGSLTDAGNKAQENFVSTQDGAFFANFYKKDNLKGGHIILLNSKDSEYYEATKSQALLALNAWPEGMQIGGGITADNAKEFLDAGASHVIVTSYVFKDGKINLENLEKIFHVVGKKHLVLDVSCRMRDGKYYVVTDRWQKFTDVEVTPKLLDELSKYCDEFLIHAVDVEGKKQGVEIRLLEMLGDWNGCPVTYAGGVSSFEDIDTIKKLGKNHVDLTIGSALDLFGGQMSYEEVKSRIK